jgi:hypothetical protein
MDDVLRVEQGMGVFDVNGDKIGTVAQVWPNAGVGNAPGVTAYSAIGQTVDFGGQTGATEYASGAPASQFGGDAGAMGYGTNRGTAGYTTPNSGETFDTSPGEADYGDTAGAGSYSGDIGSSALGADTGTGGFGTPPPSSSYQADSQTMGYFEVEHGGFLGIGTQTLFVPMSAVQSATSDGVTLECLKDVCGSLYANKPDFLG